MTEKAAGSVLCMGIIVLDIVAGPVGAPSTWKEKQEIGAIRLLAGGDAANQSIHLASLGYHAVFNGCIGNDVNGETVRTALSSRGVDLRFLRVKEDACTGSAVLLIDEAGERRIFTMKGAHRTFDRHDFPKELPADCVGISLGSLFGMPAAEKDGLKELLETARERRIPVFADLDSGKVVQGSREVIELLPLVDYFLPSHYDVTAMTGCEDLRIGVAKLRKYGANAIIVKCGEEGARIYGDDSLDCTLIPAIPVKPVDTTGAGDCMTAAFVARIIEGDGIEDAVRYACAAGTYSTLFPGANSVELTDEKVREFMEKGRK